MTRGYTCQWGLCQNSNNDKRPHVYTPRKRYFSFPNPTSKKKTADYVALCREWIKRCGCSVEQLNLQVITADFEKAPNKSSRSYFICYDHFVNGKPTKGYPCPYSANPHCEEVLPPKTRKKLVRVPVKLARRREPAQATQPDVKEPQIEVQPIPDNDPAPQANMEVRAATPPPTIVGIVPVLESTFPAKPDELCERSHRKLSLFDEF